jgi:polysaccharide biosynthesis transport protein
MQKSNSKTPAPTPGFSFGVQDIIYVLCKHKWKILFLTALGLGVAAYLHRKQEPLYKSESKLLIRYVMAKGTVDPFESISSPGGGMRGKSDPVINTEMEILYSVDLARNVAEAVGVGNLFPEAKGTPSLDDAAGVIRKGLEIAPGFSPSVVYVNYSHKQANLSKDVLTHLLERYFKRHLEIHRSAAEFDLVSKEVEDAKSRLREKEATLDQLRKETGIMSLVDATAALTVQKNKTQEDLLKARAELAEKEASLKALERDSKIGEEEAAKDRSATEGEHNKASAMAAPPSGVITEYRSVIELIGFLQKRDLELRIKFKPGNQLLMLNQRQLQTNEARRGELERQYPALTTQVGIASADPGSPRARWINEKAGLAAVQAKIDVLTAHLQEIGGQFSREYAVGAKVEELQRERDMLDAEYRTLETKLKSARVETTLDPSRMPNITVVQQPTVPVKTYDEKMQKIILGVAGSGLVLGVALAFLIELLFNRKISRPIDIQTRLQLPLLLTIPYLRGKSQGRFLPASEPDVPLISGESADEVSIPTRELASAPSARSEHFILPYTETIRDRIIFNFEINNVIHKPKLIAVTGLSEGAGASTVAAGLARSFSEIQGAKVLLIDLSSLEPEQNPLFGELPRHSVNAALQLANDPGFRDESRNLYFASAVARRDDNGLSSFSSMQLYQLMPHLQDSTYDYIIFDMPVIDQTSRTLAMAGLMDKILLVLDAENTSRDALTWGYSELVKGKGDVSCIFNKTRSHAPGWLLGGN